MRKKYKRHLLNWICRLCRYNYTNNRSHVCTLCLNNPRAPAPGPRENLSEEMDQQVKAEIDAHKRATGRG